MAADGLQSDSNTALAVFETSAKVEPVNRSDTIRSCIIGLSVLMSVSLFTGCGSTRLNLGPPGTIGMQRERAVIHDPFPSTDLGPPIVGGRPREFDLPLSQTKGLQVNPHANRLFNGF